VKGEDPSARDERDAPGAALAPEQLRQDAGEPVANGDRVTPLAQLDRDLSVRGAEIDRILRKTDAEARMLQLKGTPGFVIGHSLAPGALSLEGLEHLVAKAKDKK